MGVSSTRNSLKWSLLRPLFSTVDPKQTHLRLTADSIVINTGCKPNILPIPGIENVEYLTSETLLELTELPSHLLIVGGGYIGLEFAQIFHRLGSKVTIVEGSDQFIHLEDRDIANEVYHTLTEEGIEILLGQQITEVIQNNKSLQLSLKRDGGTALLEGSHLLLAVGRVPCSEDLGLEHTEIETDTRGYVHVNEFLQTTQRDVWAVGDIKGGAQFTHLSWDDYRVLKHNLSNPQNKRSIKDRLVPYTVFIDPELGRVGLTESQARAAGYEIKIAKMPVAKIPRAKTLSETQGVIKIIIDAKTDKLLGGAIFAAEAGESISLIQVAILAGIPYTALREVIFSHPTLAEGFNLALAESALSKGSKQAAVAK